jgi:hypothetical protein
VEVPRQEVIKMETNNMTEVETGINTEIVQYINERAENLVRYSDKLSVALKSIDKYFELIGPKAGIKFTDPEPFYTDNHEFYGKVNYKLSVRKDWGLYSVSDTMVVDNEVITGCGRPIKKAAIKRLPEFLKLYALELEKYEKEYKEISEKAEKMAAILNGEVA